MCSELDNDLSTALPRGWTDSIRSAVLNIVVLVRIATPAAREFLIQEGDVVHAKLFRLEAEVAMLRQELRIYGTRMRRIDPHRRPQYPPAERMAILELRAMRGWSKAQTARRFFVSDDTIRSWLCRADDDTLLQTRALVNRFPDVVRYVVQRIKLFCPTLGKVKIAQKLARAGIHIGKTTVERFHRTFKEILRQTTVPEDQTEFERECSLIIAWYNERRPHNTLVGKTSNEVYFSRPPANEQPRLEPHDRWPRGSPCARPLVEIDGKPGDPIVVEIDCLKGRRYLPVVRAQRAA